LRRTTASDCGSQQMKQQEMAAKLSKRRSFSCNYTVHHCVAANQNKVAHVVNCIARALFALGLRRLTAVTQ